MSKEQPRVLLERLKQVGLIRLNRPEVLNAIDQQLLTELVLALQDLDADPVIHAIVVAGDSRAFAAGADLREMSTMSGEQMRQSPRLSQWHEILQVQKPVIAAVSGFALGGGCEIALACDLVIAAESAIFGQPEVDLGLIPGGGGTQRWMRIAGKAQAMEIILNCRKLTAAEAYQRGMVTRVVADDLWLESALELAQNIAAKPPEAIRLAKQAALAAYELPLSEGLDYERQLFNHAFDGTERREAFAAFLARQESKRRDS